MAPPEIQNYGALPASVLANPDSPAGDDWIAGPHKSVRPRWEGQQWADSLYMYGDGFTSTIEWRSSVNLGNLVLHTSTVTVAPNGKPWFTVVAADLPDQPCAGNTSTGAWSVISNRLSAALVAAGLPAPRSVVSGPLMFGFSKPFRGIPVYLNNHAAAIDPNGQFTRFWKAYMHMKANRPPPIDYSDQAYEAALQAALAAGTLPPQLAAAAAVAAVALA